MEHVEGLDLKIAIDEGGGGMYTVDWFCPDCRTVNTASGYVEDGTKISGDFTTDQTCIGCGKTFRIECGDAKPLFKK